MEAWLVHSVPGRIRLKVPAARNDAAYFEKLGEALGRTQGVEAVIPRPDTASVLIAHDWESPEPLARLGRTSQLFELRTDTFEPVWQRAARRLEQMDRRMSAFTRGELGMRSAVLLSLVMVGLVQAARGQVLAPASTMLLEAFRLLGLPEEAGSRGRLRPPVERVGAR